MAPKYNNWMAWAVNGQMEQRLWHVQAVLLLPIYIFWHVPDTCKLYTHTDIHLNGGKRFCPVVKCEWLWKMLESWRNNLIFLHQADEQTGVEWSVERGPLINCEKRQKWRIRLNRPYRPKTLAKDLLLIRGVAHFRHFRHFVSNNCV